MTYIGQQPATTFDNGIQDRFTGLSTNTVTLTHEIAAEEDILVVWNNIVQDKNTYSVGGTGNKTLTLGGTLVSADVVTVYYLNKVMQSVNPTANSVGITELNLSDGSNGQVLQTNGSGTLSFATVSSDTGEDIICWGWEITASASGANFTVSAGKLMHGNTLISKTADTTLTFGTAGDWHDGAADSYSGGAGWCYVGVKSNGDLKLLGDNPAQKSDTSGNTASYPFLYWHDGSNYWRVIGAVYVNTSNQNSFIIKTTGRRANRPLVTIAEASSSSYTSHSLAAIAPKNILQLYGNIGNNGDGAGNSAQTYMNGTNDSGDVGASTCKADDANDSASKANLTDAQVSIYTDQVVYGRTANSNTNYLMQCSGWELP